MSSRPYVAELEGSPEHYKKLTVNSIGELLASVVISAPVSVIQGTSPWVVLGSVTITNGAGAASVNIQDGGNSITVDGPLTDAELRATPVPISVSGMTFASARGLLTDRSGTATNVSTTMMSANSNRKYLLIQNATGNTLWFNFTTVATNNTPSIELRANSAFVMEGSFISTEAITVIRAGGTNVPFTAKEG